MSRRLNISKGQQFNRWVVIKEVYGHKTRNGKLLRYFLCICKCGVVKEVALRDLNYGHTKSCGCLLLDKVTTHGMSYEKVYRVWEHFIGRCNNEKNKEYRNYGGRGITVCKEWLKFENFFEDMGGKPQNKSLDRIDNNKGYSKENCRWATRREQQNNMRSNRPITYEGKTMNLSQWERELGLPRNSLYTRLSVLKWTVKDAFEKPIKVRN